MSYQREIMENISFQTKLDLFSNYLNNPQNIDIGWENLIALKVNKFISASLITNLIYDHDIDIARDTDNDGVIDRTGPTTQFKEIFGMGFMYRY